MDIYWIQNHEKRGPLPAVEVFSMLEAGLMPPSVRAWHAGCNEWMPVQDLPALKEMLERYRVEQEEAQMLEDAVEEGFGKDIPETEVADQAVEDGETDQAQAENAAVLVVPYPYVRFLGRVADMLMHLTLYMALLWLFGTEFAPGLLPGSYEALLYVCLPAILIESVFLSTLGTTPGKALLGVVVRDYQGERLPFMLAFRRSAAVMVLGMGCFTPILTMPALFFSWLWVRRFGFAPWDRRLGTTAVLMDPLSMRKVIRVLLLAVICLQMLYILLYPWFPDIQAYLGAPDVG